MKREFTYFIKSFRGSIVVENSLRVSHYNVFSNWRHRWKPSIVDITCATIYILQSAICKNWNLTVEKKTYSDSVRDYVPSSMMELACLTAAAGQDLNLVQHTQHQFHVLEFLDNDAVFPTFRGLQRLGQHCCWCLNSDGYCWCVVLAIESRRLYK